MEQEPEYKWLYTGGEEGSAEAAHRGEQRAHRGDRVCHNFRGGGSLSLSLVRLEKRRHLLHGEWGRAVLLGRPYARGGREQSLAQGVDASMCHPPPPNH